MGMTVGELKEALDDYGDHLPVVIVVNQGEDDKTLKEYDVVDGSYDNLPAVQLYVD